MTDYIVVFCTVPDSQTAKRIAADMVEQRHAACVNIVAGIQSVYEWQGKVEFSDEHLLIMKTKRNCYASLEDRLLDQHPYDTPEIIAMPVEAGLADYLQWIELTTRPQD